MSATPQDTKRHDAERRGRGAERLAALWLRAKDYRILARRFQCRAGEIALVARRGRMLVFIEVKARDTGADAADAVTPRQRRRIERAAETSLRRQPELAGLDLRCDAVLVRPGRLPTDIVDAWRPGL